jgi:hypothetical protein
MPEAEKAVARRIEYSVHELSQLAGLRHLRSCRFPAYAFNLTKLPPFGMSGRRSLAERPFQFREGLSPPSASSSPKTDSALARRAHA